MMKIWKYTGTGRALNSNIIAIAEKKRTANKLIKNQVESLGLKFDGVHQIRYDGDFTGQGIVYAWDGEY